LIELIKKVRYEVEEMMVTNVSLRVLLIGRSEDTATAFYIERNNLQYIITARHVFEDENYPSKSAIKFRIGKEWIEKNVEIFYHKSKVDVAVLRLIDHEDFKPKYAVDFDNRIDMGGELYFLGYPYGLSMEDFQTGDNDRPLPLIKKGIFSGVLMEDGQRIFLLDGHNNPGFSGGPVYYRTTNSVFIAGVISSYSTNRSMLHDMKHQELPYYIAENSGIVRFIDIIYVLEIINTIKIKT